MIEKRRELPASLDMSFSEALERFMAVKPSALQSSQDLRKQETIEKGSKMATWEKPLSKTEALQETTGGLVPYLRLTRGTPPNLEYQTWFREEFFAGQEWVLSTFGKTGDPVEETYVPFVVSIRGKVHGTETMRVTHAEGRQENHKAPCTWVHWNDGMTALLESENFTRHVARLTREKNGTYHLDIRPPKGVGAG